VHAHRLAADIGSDQKAGDLLHLGIALEGQEVGRHRQSFAMLPLTPASIN
jgi:hypothetical protein